MTTWATLFERGAAYDVDVDDVRDTLAERRHDDKSADDSADHSVDDSTDKSADDSTDKSADDSTDGQRPQSDTDE